MISLFTKVSGEPGPGQVGAAYQPLAGPEDTGLGVDRHPPKRPRTLARGGERPSGRVVVRLSLSRDRSRIAPR